MEVKIEVCMMADDGTMILKPFEGKNSVSEAIEFLTALKIKTKIK